MLTRAYPQSVGVGDFWSGVVDFFNPNITTPDFIKANIWNWQTQPEYTPAKPPGAVVPDIAAYNNFNRWCSPTDADCLNGITNQTDPNVSDAQRNLVNYRAAQLAAIAQAEREAAEKDAAKGLPDWAMYLAIAGIGVAGYMAISSKRGGR